MKRYAAIDIGAHAVKLKIVERSNKNKTRVLEDVVHPLMLGYRVFEHGRLMQEDIEEVSKTLAGFKRLMQEYHIDAYRAVATSVIRSAWNGRFAMSIISQRVQLDIEILEEPVERFLTYIALELYLDDYHQKRKEGLLVVEVGSISSEVILYKDNKLVRNNELQLGTIPLKQLLNQMRRVSLYPEQILSDHIYAQTANLQGYLIRQQIPHVAMVGADIRRIRRLIGLASETLSAEHFGHLKQAILSNDKEVRHQLLQSKLDYEEIVVAVLVFEQFVRITEVVHIDMPSVSLRDGILLSLFDNIESFDRSYLQTKDILSCARYMAKRHHGTMAHIRHLEKHCVKLFDVYKGREGFDEQDLLCLRLAAILHETGKFTRQSDYHEATFQNIANASILGLKQSLMRDVAAIAMQSFEFSELEERAQRVRGRHVLNDPLLRGDESSGGIVTNMKAIKLGLLLALADASDKSKRQSIKLQTGELTKDSLVLNFVGQTSFLETWALQGLKNHMMDVFGHSLHVMIREA